MLVAFIPPHLLLLFLAAAVVVFLVALRIVRRSPDIRQAVEDTLGDDTPRHALDDLQASKAAARSRAGQARADAAQLDDTAAQLEEELGDSE